ncbi:MAG: hypothetical protein GX451_03165 [Acholeplasmataceae bacterium]|nr:hypothetical protein [Acholeplasmataceae bacterium]
METFKLKVSVGNAEINLEGDGELVHIIFQELKESGLGKLAPSAINYQPATTYNDIIENTCENNQKSDDLSDHTPPSQTQELPTLENVVLQGTPKTESDWLLIYAVYCSEQGKTLFTKDDLRTKYNETNRMTDARSKNFMTNVKSLVSSKYISAVNANEFRLENDGLVKAKAILNGSGDSTKSKRNGSTNKKKALPTYKMLDLDLSPDQRSSLKAFWTQHNHSANIDKSVLIAFWLNKETAINNFTVDHFFSILRTLDENASFDLASAISNAKNKKSYFIPDSSNGSFKLTHIGEDHVKTLETMETTLK